MMSYYIEVWKKYAVFQGRAGRLEYWLYTLTNLAIAFPIPLLGWLSSSLTGNVLFIKTAYAVAGLYNLLQIIPTIAVTVRRLHDTNRSGWWIWLGLLPILGPIVLLFFLASNSDALENQYGPCPKNVQSEGSCCGECK
jgi:uncharacterized membrane protein YhaH (DUF805 family)